MPATGTGQRSRKSRVIEESGTPARRAARSAGRSGGTPWETNTQSAPVMSSSRFAPSERIASVSSMAARASPSSSGPRISETVTRAPWAARKRVRSIPSMPSPTTVTRAPVRSGARAKAPSLLCLSTRIHQTASASAIPTIAADHSEQPEPHHHLRLAPADQLQVVVERRHAKEALPAGRLEVGDLRHRRAGLDHVDDSDDSAAAASARSSAPPWRAPRPAAALPCRP